MVGHKISSDPTDPGSGNKTVLIDVTKQVAATFKTQFPLLSNSEQIKIFPALGNNDYWIHASAPYSIDKNEFYSFYYDTWFN